MSGPARLKIRRWRVDIGAYCQTCDWQMYDCSRQRAMKHARDTGHGVSFVVEETTIYKP